jgi:endothelin-converting enzyme/putative endopeptidase
VLKSAVLSAVCAFTLAAQQAPPAAPKQQPVPKLHPEPAPTPPETASHPQSKMIRFNVNAMDKSADPCSDFYQYACGNWIKTNPIPPDQSSWGRFAELEERNKETLRGILEAAANPSASRDAISRQIGDYYAACMDEKTIDAKGLKPVEPALARIAALKDKSELASEIARLHRSGAGALFDFSSGQDFKDSNAVIAQFDQGGIGLPDRDYYLKDDPESVEIRHKYIAHIQRMLELAGDSPDAAKRSADVVMRIESSLARGSLDRVSRRDPEKVYHKMTTRELEALSPSFRWTAYFRDTGAPSFNSINVAWPDFAKAMEQQIQSESLDDWKTYLRWHLIHSSAPFLPAGFVQERFNFYGKALTGAAELRPRWKRCVDYTDGELGEALGRKFVEKTFGAEGKKRTLEMVAEIEKALSRDIESLDWMTPATKQQAEIKLKAVTNKIGYPDHYRDYSSVAISRDDAMGNTNRADEFEFHRRLQKIGKPVDRSEWEMTPPTVNAYYDPLMNNINFPAGILQPPFYDNGMDDAVNYGGIGMVIGHELTHGFDDEGRQFDAKGNLHDWWTEADSKAFSERVACIADEYSSVQVAPGLHINGKLTLGENTADNGGARIAYMALMDALAGKTQPKIDGFTPEQRFFLAFGQIWCANERPEALRLQVQTDPHSPPKDRVNGAVVNMPEFRKAFSCKAGAPMVKQSACRVW